MLMCRKRKHKKIKLYQFEFKMQNSARISLTFCRYSKKLHSQVTLKFPLWVLSQNIRNKRFYNREELKERKINLENEAKLVKKNKIQNKTSIYRCSSMKYRTKYFITAFRIYRCEWQMSCCQIGHFIPVEWWWCITGTDCRKCKVI